jgi:hypothetical protein
LGAPCARTGGLPPPAAQAGPELWWMRSLMHLASREKALSFVWRASELLRDQEQKFANRKLWNVRQIDKLCVIFLSVDYTETTDKVSYETLSVSQLIPFATNPYRRELAPAV